MSVETTASRARTEPEATLKEAPKRARAARRVPRPRTPATAPVVVIVDAVGDSAIRHSCGAMVTPLFGVGGPTSCPLCHETV